MKSTLYLKFIIIYIIFGFLSLFTLATLTDNLISSPMEKELASDMYKEANMVATNYLPSYFSEQITTSDVHLQLSGIESHLDASVWFVDREGSLIASAQSDDYPPSPNVIEDFNPAESGSSQYTTGDYHGYFQEDVITVIAPVVQN